MPHAHVNGVEIFYEEFGTGEPLLLLHGMLETGRTHARDALIFSKSYRVIVPDLRGYGRSRPPPRTFPADFYARDADDMAALLRHLGIRDARVVGIADGAEVGLLLAITAPELVHAVVAASVAAVLPEALLPLLPVLGNWAAEVPSNDLAWRSEAIREYGLAATQAMWQDWKAAVRAIVARGGDISLSRAGAIRCPVLIVNGSEDTLNTPAMSQALAAAIPQATLHMVADVGQLVYDNHRRLFANLALEWLVAH